MTWDTNMRIYIDGAEVPVAGGFGVAFEMHPLAIGADLSDTTRSRFLAGALHDLRVHNRVLVPAEIAVLAQP